MIKTLVFVLFQGQGTSIFGAKDLENSDCASCQQYARRTRVNNERLKARTKGVPEHLLVKYTEVSLGSNRNCPICLQRLAYKDRRNKEYRAKRKDS